MINRSLPTLIAAVLTGCAGLAPAPRHSDAGLDAAPGSWSAHPEAKAGIDHQWISRFGDRQLTALVKEALAQNPDLRAAAARVESARAEVRLAAVGRKPTLDANFNSRRNKQNFIGFPFGGDPAGEEAPPQVASSLTNSFGLSLDLSWELDLWGRVRAGESAAIATTQAADADLRAARASLAAQVAKAYFALVESSQQLAIAEQNLKALTETETVTRERFETGQTAANSTLSVATDYRLTKADVATARAGVEGQRSTKAAAARQLEALLGRYPAGAVNSTPTLTRVPSRPPAGLPSELVLRRPDIQAAERRFAASGSRISEAKRARYPQFRITGSTGTSTEELAKILDSDFGVWSLAGNALQPILTGGQVKASIIQRTANEKAAMYDLQQTVITAFKEVETALATDPVLARQEDALGRAAKLYKEAEDQAREDYRNGLADILTIITAQTRRLSAESQRITLRRQRLDNRINLHLALGGDFKPRPTK